MTRAGVWARRETETPRVAPLPWIPASAGMTVAGMWGPETAANARVCVIVTHIRIWYSTVAQGNLPAFGLCATLVREVGPLYCWNRKAPLLRAVSVWGEKGLGVVLT